MSKEIVDQIYINLLLAQKPYGDKQRYHKELGELVKSLCQKGIAAGEGNLLEEAKKRYVSHLYLKAESLFQEMNYEVLSKTELVNYLKTEKSFFVLANYYRNAYYGLFYVARALFVALEDIDCSEHKDLWEKIRKLISDKEKRIEKVDKDLEKIPEGEDKEKLNNNLSNLRVELSKFQAIEFYRSKLKDLREIGDYSLLEKQRKDLADQNILEEAYKNLEKALNAWSDLK